MSRRSYDPEYWDEFDFNRPRPSRREALAEMEPTRLERTIRDFEKTFPSWLSGGISEDQRCEICGQNHSYIHLQFPDGSYRGVSRFCYRKVQEFVDAHEGVRFADYGRDVRDVQFAGEDK